MQFSAFFADKAALPDPENEANVAGGLQRIYTWVTNELF